MHLGGSYQGIHFDIFQSPGHTYIFFISENNLYETVKYSVNIITEDSNTERTIIVWKCTFDWLVQCNQM